VAYIEDLMQAQVRRDNEVTYFFSGRYVPYVTGPRLKRWQHDGVAMLEVVSSPLYDHGRQPELELAEPRIERMVERAIREVRPDVMHVHELAGLPSSVLDVARRLGVCTIVTLQDYFPLCGTFRLLDSGGRVCLRREVGEDCVHSTAADPRKHEVMFDSTVRYELARLPLLRSIDPARRDPWINRVARLLAERAVAQQGRARPNAGAFQRRRDVNVERLNRADRVIAMSTRVAEIYAQLGVDADRLETRQLTLAHIERLRPRRRETGTPITFATLAGLESVAKGGRLLLDAMRLLSEAASAGRMRLLVYGFTDLALAQEAAGLAGIELRGSFRAGELDTVLDEVDIGVMPSVWEEAYGYAGMEFLAKGIPVVANAIGGMVDYTLEGETGWLNRSCSAEELARIVLGIVESPEQVGELAAKVRAARDTIIKPLSRHADEMDAVYREAMANGSRREARR
jgi:glycosyltransferase involved in cell wall biosynthesis